MSVLRFRNPAFGKVCNKALKDLGNEAQEFINAFLDCPEPWPPLAHKMSFYLEALDIQFSIKEKHEKLGSRRW